MAGVQRASALKCKVLRLLDQAGPAGLDTPSLRAALETTSSGLSTVLKHYAHMGTIVCRGEARQYTWVHPRHAATGGFPTLGPVLSAPQPRALQRQGFVNPAMRADRATFIRLKDQGQQAVVADGVKVTCVPYVGDTRYRVDPATFEGGEFSAEWRAKRAGAAV